MGITIILLRHAEKPDDDDDNTLSKRGSERAAALSAFLPNRFGHPDYLFAARDSKESRRSRLTLVPLSEATTLPVDATFENKDYKDLAEHITSGFIRQGTLVIVAWHQGNLPELAHALGASDAPQDWPNSVFDRLWRVYIHKNGEVDFEVIPQKLMYKDSD